MNDESNWLIRGPSAFAWLALIAIITAVAAVGLLSEHGPTAAAILAAIATLIGTWTAIATLTGNKKKANRVLTTTAVLSAVAALLVREGDTIRQIVTDPDPETAILGAILIGATLLTYIIYRYNCEDDEP